LFLGNTYLPTGWKAFVNGNETKIYRTNHGFNGIIVPKGNNKVEFKYAPKSFFIGKNISLAINIILLVLFVIAIFLYRKNKQKENIPLNA